MIENNWKILGGTQAVILRDILEHEASLGDIELHIGTDSQQNGKFTDYVTVVVARRKTEGQGRGARVFYTKERVPRIKSLRERLYREAWRSVELGMELTGTPDIGVNLLENVDISIHIDANPNLKYKSSAYVQELAGLAVGQGFKTLLKPDSWAASHAADHAVKNRAKPIKEVA